MKKLLLFISLAIFSVTLLSQEDTLRFKLDSIVKEADLLYAYEKVAWNAGDLAMANKSIMKNFGGYIVYHHNDTLIATFLNQDQSESIARYYFLNTELDVPFNTVVEQTPVTKEEQKLQDIKVKIVQQLADDKYDVSFYKDFDPNLEIIKENNLYKLYIIMGTTKPDIIPFGNDYLFIADQKGKIISWKKFHSTIIPTECTSPDGFKVVSAIHSHLKTTPYMTATDICTFRLYGSFHGMEEFRVLSTALNLIFTYNLKENKISVSNP